MANGEREICERARTGDREALGELVALYRHRLKLWALWEVGDFALADHACQETWVSLTKSGTEGTVTVSYPLRFSPPA